MEASRNLIEEEEGSVGSHPGLSKVALVADGEPVAMACAGGRGSR
jgi:hypothetical protein